ncbi:hypothetical protein BAC2_00373 [uncultured bacterium]|nr:hypothetical protein BAC2_00373 [uncultured bacterium]
MSGALKSVFGGNGGILGAVLGVASMFFPPLAIANSLSNLLTQAIGEAVKQLASYAMKELGMPKFLQQGVNALVDGALGGLQRQSSGDVDAAVQDRFGPAVQEFGNQTFEAMKKVLKETHEAEKSNSSSGSGKSSGKSWYVKLSMALGQAMNAQADKVEKLADEVNKTFSADGKKVENQQKNFDKMQELQAETQVMGVLANTVSQAVSKIGEALTTASRAR